MNFQTRAIIGIAVIIGFIFFQKQPKEVDFKLTNDDLQGIILVTEGAFIEAEKAILDVDEPAPPEPDDDDDDDDDPVGPNPDPAKCICKGTGKIVQGDGHVSACPYHGVKDVPQKRGGILRGRLFGR